MNIIFKVREIIFSGKNSIKNLSESELNKLYTAFEDANSRIKSAGDYVKNSDYKRLVEEVEREPELFSVINSLRFNQLPELIQQCKQFNIREPEVLSIGDVKTLEDAYCKAKVLPLLIDKQRKIVHTGDAKSKVALLRKITRINQESDWVNMLQKQEQIWVEELKDQAKIAIKNNNELVLEDIHSTLSSSNWLDNIDTKVLDKISHELKTMRTKRLIVKASAIMETINDAFSAQDEEAVAIGVMHWNDITDQVRPDIEESAFRHIRQIEKWLATKEEARQEEITFSRIIRTIEQSLNDEKPYSEILPLFNQARNLDRVLPASLEERLKKAREAQNLALQRSGRRKVVISVVSIVAILVIGGILFRNHQLETALIDRVHTLNTLLDKGDYQSAQKIIDKMFYENSELLGNTQITDCQDRLKKMQKKEADRLAFFNLAIENLYKSEKKAFQPFEISREQLQEAKKYVKLPIEKKKLKTLERKLLLAIDANQRSIDAVFRKRVTKLDQQISTIANIDFKVAEENFQAELTDGKNMLDLIKSSEKVSSDLFTEELTRLTEALGTYDSQYENFRQKRSVRERLTLALHNNFLPLSRYKDILEEYVRELPIEAKELNFQNILDNFRVYEAASQMIQVLDFRLEEEDRNILQTFVDKFGADNVWMQDAQILLNEQDPLNNAVEIIIQDFKRVKNRPFMSYYGLLFEAKDGRIIELYAKDKPEGEGNPPKNSKLDYGRFIFSSLKNSTSEDVIKFDIRNSISGWYIYGYDDNIGTTKLLHDELKPISVNSNMDCAHGVFWQQMLHRLGKLSPDKIEEFLLRQVLETRRNEEINSLLRLEFIELFLDALVKLVPEGRGLDYKKLTEDITDFKTDSFNRELDWLSLSGSEKDKIDKFIDNMPSFSNKLIQRKLESDIQLMNLRRDIKAIGIYFAKDKSIRFLANDDYRYAELWIVEGNSLPQFRLIAEGVTDRKNIPVEILNNLRNGEIIFAPQNSASTSDLQKNFIDRAKELDFRITWPSAWPCNKRDL